MLRAGTLHRLCTYRVVFWLALVAVLLGALAPTVSRALAAAHDSGAILIEVCSSNGPRWVPAFPELSTTDSSNGQESTSFLDHCPFCLLIADRLGPPPATFKHFLNAESGLAPSDVQALFFPDALPVQALPRGPPACS